MISGIRSIFAILFGSWQQRCGLSLPALQQLVATDINTFGKNAEKTVSWWSDRFVTLHDLAALTVFADFHSFHLLWIIASTIARRNITFLPTWHTRPMVYISKRLIASVDGFCLIYCSAIDECVTTEQRWIKSPVPEAAAVASRRLS